MPILFSAPVAAHDTDNDKDDNKWQGDTEFKKGDNKFELDSKAQENSSSDDQSIKVDLRAGLKVQIVLQHSTDRVNTRMSVLAEFGCLIGLKEGEKPGQVSCDSSAPNRSLLPFSKMVFNVPDYSNDTKDQETIHRVLISTKDGMFQLKLEISGDFAKDNGTPQPEPLSMYFKVHDFKFGKDDRYLGLNLKITSNVVIKVDKDLPGLGGKEIVQGRSPSDGKDEELGSTYLALNGKASVDGDQKDVTSSVSGSGDGDVQVYAAFPRGENLQEELRMGLQPVPIVLKGDTPAYIAGIGAIVGIFALTDKRVLALLTRKGR